MRFDKDTTIDCLLILFIVIIMASIIPLLCIAYYAHPSADDYVVAINTHRVWLESSSIVEVAKTAFHDNISWWYNWQGLYTTMFILAFNPIIFGDQYYFIVPIFFIVSMMVAIFILFRRVSIMSRGDKHMMIFSFGIVFYMCMQYMPGIAQGIYWCSGAVAYTFNYILLIILFSLLIKLIFDNDTSNSRNSIFVVLGAIIAAFIIAGGSQVVAFESILIVTASIIYVIIIERKMNRGDIMNKRLMGLLIILMTLLVSFLFNITSPGTAVRQSHFGARQGIIDAIMWSCKETYILVRGWVNVPYISSMILVLLIYVKKNKVKLLKSSFIINPFIVGIFLFLFLAALSFPPYYAMGNGGDKRVENVIYFTFVIGSVLVLYYTSMWINMKLIPRYRLILLRFIESNIYIPLIVIIMLSLFIVMPLYSSNSTKAYMQLSNGEAYAYHQEIVQRYEFVKLSREDEVLVPSLVARPSILFFKDLNEYPSTNDNFAEYYGKKAVYRIDN